MASDGVVIVSSPAMPPPATSSEPATSTVPKLPSASCPLATVSVTTGLLLTVPCVNARSPESVWPSTVSVRPVPCTLSVVSPVRARVTSPMATPAAKLPAPSPARRLGSALPEPSRRFSGPAPFRSASTSAVTSGVPVPIAVPAAKPCQVPVGLAPRLR